MERYRIQTREFSPDVIEKNIGTPDKPRWVVYLCPCGSRFNKIAHELCEYLNFSGLHDPDSDY